MLTIINFVPKIQALDKSAAMLAEIRSQIPASTVISIISLAENNTSEHIEPLVGLLAEVSETTAFVGDHPSFNAAYALLTAGGRSVSRVLPKDLIALVEGFVSTERRTLFLSPVGKGIGDVGDSLLAWARVGRVPVVGYFKSLHDQGFGLSSLMNSGGSDTGVFNGFRKIVSRMSRQEVFSRGATPGKLGPEHTDFLMVFNDHHRQLVAGKVGSARVFESGYPLLYPRWHDLVSRSSFCQEFAREAALEVVLFTRGEAPGRRPEENVVPHANLEILINDIISGLEQTEKHWRMRIKPHPIQDSEILEEIVSGRANVEIVNDAPTLLAKTCDVAIATYSSTVVDTLSSGVPTIEYFFETPFFRKKHPGGSPFPQMGVFKARNRTEFFSSLEEAISTQEAVSNIKSLSVRPDFSTLMTDVRV